MKTLLEKSIPHQQATISFSKEVCDTFLKAEKNFTMFFEGGLGAGKTFFIREILRQYGVKSEIPSPTYIFHSQYETTQQLFSHFDFYRLADPQEFFARGFAEIAEDQSICKLIEWPDKISKQTRDSFSGTHFTLRLEYGIGVGMRKMKILQ
jgi:tRNA threonylcarbamoyladenosine biosynthesis protein TsaE